MARRPLARLAVAVLLPPLTGCGLAGCGLAGGPPAPRPWPSATPLSWQWQLSGEPDATVAAQVFVLDPFTSTLEVTGQLAPRRLFGPYRRLVCHLDAGRYEPTRPDAERFPPEIIGAGSPDTGDDGGAPPADGARWLDIRRWDLLRPVLADRLRLCLSKRFDAVAFAGWTATGGRPDFR
ncbi:endo alpha-1,4 polygalactosaminidase [Plantactinospora sp. KBS50]|uniref:endo alpha-1,4 polygalactosaminidase n=1 Tax=Plantactinospora sp. KBS50 TaxID=2024580 RepID=UPI000BAAB08E|nr:endo alpha-1,4 polygalactosaminidase [Plantactinospora sp. KBS50]ASW53992.1 hypothetical protein CIK06_07050 [Plantactinospora sp. KBS50]